jgi:glycosyltransferase involved in cell wall biosynthesis
MRTELEMLARQANLSAGQIRFVGRVAASEIPFWLRASDIFSLTSPSEGFACALLEAMSVGLPSVVSAIPANLQLIDEGVHGLTVPFDGEEAIAEALLKLFQDGGLRKKMGNAAHLRAVENYSTAKVIERYEALFETLTMPDRPDARQ